MPPEDDWTARALDTLERRAGRRTAARRAVVEHLGRQACAVSASDVEDALKADDLGVGRATIYRVLEQLREARLVQKLDTGHGAGLYEPVRHGRDHHHHLVCDDCGDVVPFADSALERALAKVADRVDFRVADHDVVLHGSCGTCTG